MLKRWVAALAVAVALVSHVEAAPVFPLGDNEGFFNSFENIYRAAAACTPATCFPFDPAADPPGGAFLRIIPREAFGPGTGSPSIMVGDIFVGIMNVQNIDNNGVTIFFASATDQFTGYFAQQVGAIIPKAAHPSLATADHLLLVAPTVDPFGVLGPGEQFRLYINDGPEPVTPLESNGTIADDIAKATDGTLWASFGTADSDGAGPLTTGFAYSHIDLALALPNFSDQKAFVAVNRIIDNTGLTLAPINDVNECEIGGGPECFPPSTGTRAEVVGSAELEINPGAFPIGGAGRSPWIFRNNDPFTLRVIVSRRQNNSEIPGSVLVFPKFITGTVNVGNGTTVPAPRTSFEISVTCPVGSRCAENQRVKLMAHWVCPGYQDRFENKFICEETDFELFTTVKGTLMFHPEPNLGLLDFVTPNAAGGPGPVVPPGVTIVSPALTVSEPPCAYGYLIVWVINFDDADHPRAVSFNGLIGNAVIREADGSAGAYNAIPIQSVQPTGTILDPIDPNDEDRTLHFDGVTEYAQLPGKIVGTVRADRNFGGSVASYQIDSYLTLLTLDVNSNRSNLPTFVDLNFFNEVETLRSTFTEFICWAEKSLSGSFANAQRHNTRATGNDPSLNCDPLILATGTANSCNQSPFGFINRNLREPFGRKLLVESGQAVKEQLFGIFDADCPPGTASCPVTLLGLVETKERRVIVNGGTTSGPIVREYSYNLFHTGDGVSTRFRPN